MSAIKAFLKKIPAEQHALIRSLDAMISKSVPTLTASLKWGNLTYHGENNVCSLVSHKHHVNLQIWGGARLNDPRGLLTGTGKDMRHIKLVSETDVDSKYIADLLKQAARLGSA